MSTPAGKDEMLRRIRSRIAGDLRPVEPLSPGWRRALFVLPYALVAVAALLWALGLRFDAAAIGPELLWGLAAIQLVGAYLVFFVALLHAVPGSAVGPRVWLGFPVLVFALQIGVAWWTHEYSPLETPPGTAEKYGMACFGLMSLLGVVPLATGLWLLSRGFALRPRIAGLLTGFGSGLVAEAVYRMHCPYSDLSHIIPWHGGAVLTLGVVGFGAGVWWESRRLRQWKKQRDDAGVD